MEIRLIAECFGALGLMANIFGYRQDNINRYLWFSAGALVCLSLHFFLIDAMAAGVGCGLAALRNVLAIYFRGRALLAIFFSLNIGFFIYEWFILQHSSIILLAYLSNSIFTVGSVLLTDTVRMRRWFVFAEGFGLLYALLVGSIFGSIFNAVNLINILLKMGQTKKAP